VQKLSALEELLKEYHENRLAHAFLIETNNQELCYQSLVSFLKQINCPNDYEENCSKCNLCHLFDTNNLPSFIVIRPEGTTIKKEQILSLKQSFQTKPTFSIYNMYVVINAEMLNSSSANTMLKFLEEPEEHILGFFITNNKENIIETIRSRCQVLLDYYPETITQDTPKVWQSIACNYVKEVEISGTEALLYNRDVVLPLVHDRKELFYLFQSILNIYQTIYHCFIFHNDLPEEWNSLQFMMKKDKTHIFKRMNDVIEILDILNYNLNISLVLDRFVLEGDSK